MSRLNATVAKRVKKFLDLLEEAEPESPIDIARFEKVIKEEEGERAGGQSSIDRKLAYALDRAEEKLTEGKKIARRDGVVIVTSNKATIFDRRVRKASAEKRLVAEGLIYWLFGPESFQAKAHPVMVTEFFDGSVDGVEVGSSEEENPQADYERRKIKLGRILHLKRDNLRKISALMVVLDAGSSNYFVIQHLLTANSMPLRVVAKERDIEGNPLKKQFASRLISPTIITNSIPIANAIACSKHFRSMRLSLVGGTELAERRSICGEASMLWLRACQASGVIASADLAIIGTSGYRDNFVGGLPAFGCDDPSEANLKAEMLKLASHGLRVCVLDSRKLIGTEFNSCFTTMTASTLDLVAIDAGRDDGSADAVKIFCQHAYEHGVGVIVAKS